MNIDTTDPEYEERVGAAIIQAILASLLDKETNTSFERSAEVTAACLRTIAFALATSDATSSPEKTRKVTDHLAKRLRNMIGSYKKAAEAGALDFVAVVNPGQPH